MSVEEESGRSHGPVGSQWSKDRGIFFSLNEAGSCLGGRAAPVSYSMLQGEGRFTGKLSKSVAPSK